MKSLILILFICGSVYCQDAIEKLENSYVKKAEQLRATRDKTITEADAKLHANSRRLAEAYLKSLKALLKTETQKGDFDAAIAVKAKIKEIEKALAGVKAKVTKVAPTITKPISVHHDLIGVWQTTNTKGTKYIYTFYKNGTSFHENNSNKNTIKGKWKAQGNDIHIVFSNKHSFTLKRSGNIYIGPHYKFKKHDNNAGDPTDRFIGKWKSKSQKGNWQGVVLTVSKTGNKYKLHHSKSNRSTSASIVIDRKLILALDKTQTIVFAPNSKGATYTQYDHKFNGKYPSSGINAIVQLIRISP